MKRSTTAAEKRHLASVAALGCIVCSHAYGNYGTPAEVHHARARHGWGRTSHLMTIPLCPEHHTGQTGIHGLGRKAFERTYKLTELDLLAMTIEALA